jgi:Zn finger protein HypA/HybF involved in hydrogenase expression
MSNIELTGEFECKECGRIQSIKNLKTCPNCHSEVTLKRFVNCSVGCVPLDVNQELESYLFTDRYSKPEGL